MLFESVVQIVNSIPRKLNERLVPKESTIKTQIFSLKWFTYAKYLKIIIMLFSWQLDIFIYYISLLIIKPFKKNILKSHPLTNTLLNYSL